MMPVMPKFSIKDMLISVALVALGLGCAAFIWRFDDGQRPSEGFVVLIYAIYFVGCMVAGAGCLFPFKRWGVGVAIGAASGFAILLTLHPRFVP
jgi:hypothetical protein